VEMDVSMRGGAVVMEPVGSRWDRLVAEVRRQAAERGLSEGDIDLAMAEARDREA
jgi:virulence-associated protein VagC